MKKGFILSIFILCSILFSACLPSDEESGLNRYTDTIYSMHTAIGVQIYTTSRTQFNTYIAEIEEIYETYDALSDNYKSYHVAGILNIFDINETANKEDAEDETKFIISQELYDLLEFGLEIQELSNGYFNMSMGFLVDLWKDLIEKYNHAEIIPDEVLQETKTEAQAFEFIENPITLDIIDEEPTLIIKKGVKLDLGAIAKGYATQKAVDYLETQGVKGYLINGGSSSINVGEKPNSKNEDFVIGLQHPLAYPLANNYGIISLKNINITTSGSYEQYVTDSEGRWLTHIVSPITKEPANYYYTITIIGENAGLMDGLSTALFCMEPDVLRDFLADKDIEAIGFDINEEIIRVNPTDRFESRL